MRKIAVVYGIILLIAYQCYGQNFSFTDSVYTVGAQRTSSLLYDPNCQIARDSRPFIDSLANFLLRNEKIAITIEFYTNVKRSDNMEKKRAEICGQERLSSYLSQAYTTINQKRIQYAFLGYSISSQTIIRITDTNFED
jgi:hypothetical protein